MSLDITDLAWILPGYNFYYVTDLIWSVAFSLHFNVHCLSCTCCLYCFSLAILNRQSQYFPFWQNDTRLIYAYIVLTCRVAPINQAINQYFLLCHWLAISIQAFSNLVTLLSFSIPDPKFPLISHYLQFLPVFLSYCQFFLTSFFSVPAF